MDTSQSNTPNHYLTSANGNIIDATKKSITEIYIKQPEKSESYDNTIFQFMNPIFKPYTP